MKKNIKYLLMVSNLCIFAVLRHITAMHGESLKDFARVIRCSVSKQPLSVIGAGSFFLTLKGCLI